MRSTTLPVFLILIFLSCTSHEPETSDKISLFTLLSSEETGIDFRNEIVENNAEFNLFKYRNFYNGGGVSIGDINQDGLSDIYLTSNMGKNKLYLNKGNLKFEDITVPAGVEGDRAWSTGVVMVDINNDHLLDIYVCNAGYLKGDDHQNELFINNGDLTFTESAAEYGLNDNGYSTHAAFFDYDNDGDLDAYILNNSFIPVNTLNYSNKRELYAEDWPVKDFIKGGGDKLLRNDNNTFVDVTREAGIFGSLIGFGLGITVGDVNNDNLPDLYISNDFFERDYLYINNGDGTFKEDIKNWMAHISLSSMGADMADINNDGYPEIFVTEMLPRDEKRLKTKVLFENYQTYQLKLQRDFYHQYMQNTLQLNSGDDSFNEVSRYAGVAASDWSWGALMFDADNDGYRDIYVCNGVYRDVTDQDFIDFFANDIIQKMVLTGEKEDVEKVLNKMPSNPLPNSFFRNQGDLTFQEEAESSGLGMPSFSNGAAYGDLDNDGDNDLVVNNLNQELFFFRNNSEKTSGNHYVSVNLKGSENNTMAIGSKVLLYTGNQVINFQAIPTRGFQSSVDYKMVFGLGKTDNVDSAVVIWPDSKRSVVFNLSTDSVYTFDYAYAMNYDYKQSETESKILSEVETGFEPHREDDYVDFYQEGLIIKMLSREGPKIEVGDLNGDGMEDVFIGSSSRQSAQIYLQTADGFSIKNQNAFLRDAYFEDTAARLFDADNDGDLDLFVGSGGNNMNAGSRLMQDRLYLNDGKGKFSVAMRAIPKNVFNTSVVIDFDIDGDGDLDLFVGSRSIPVNYGVSPSSFIYINEGNGIFSDRTRTFAPELQKLGMVTDAVRVDIMGDSEEELVIVGEWMEPVIFKLENKKLVSIDTDLKNYPGWWYAVKSDDVDKDGDMDLILGNRGENFYFTGNTDEPVKLWLKDFDNNGTVEKVITKTVEGKDIPIPLKNELTSQVVSLKKQNLRHEEYADKSIQELFTRDELENVVVKTSTWFKSSIAINEGGGKFTIKPMPAEVQFSCVCDIFCTDLNGDGYNDLVLGGNDNGFMPQFSKLDASHGHVLLNDRNGAFDLLRSSKSGFNIGGEIKQIEGITFKGDRYILTAINNRKPKLLKIN